jgi:HAD superfamily hydrolase (TIGR01549 family)
LKPKWVCLDVGETLIDETRIWSLWADELGISRLTFLAAFGAAVARGGEHQDVFSIVGRPDWREVMPRVLEKYGGFRHDDLYPDALPAVRALRDAGYRIALVANQPVQRTADLRGLGFQADVIAMSEELGVHKPQPEFFAAALRLMGDPEPGSVAYVGDRADNDVRPARAAGMRAVWIRRGPWGVIWDGAPDAVLAVDSLTELVERIGEAWAPARVHG